MYKKKILFSIITVVLNNRKKVEKCIKSVLSQNYQNFEHIIIDGGSTDGTHNVLKKYNRDVKKIIIKKDNNMWEAMNTGIKKANGEIICILNSDDYFTKNALKIVNNYFSKNNIDYFFGAVKKRKIFYHFNPEHVDYKFNCYPSHSVSFFIKKKIHNKIGLYDEKLKYCADYDLFYKLFKNKKFKYMNGKRSELIGYFDKSGASSRIGLFKTLYYESKVRIKNKQNILIVIFLFILRVLNKFRNYFR
jgi:glycosyltransferase involved in cell wall biosynthesis